MNWIVIISFFLIGSSIFILNEKIGVKTWILILAWLLTVGISYFLPEVLFMNVNIVNIILFYPTIIIFHTTYKIYDNKRETKEAFFRRHKGKPWK